MRLSFSVLQVVHKQLLSPNLNRILPNIIASCLHIKKMNQEKPVSSSPVTSDGFLSLLSDDVINESKNSTEIKMDLPINKVEDETTINKDEDKTTINKDEDETTINKNEKIQVDSMKGKRRIQEVQSKSAKKMKKNKNKKIVEKEVDESELYNLTDYYFENGLRKVYPYSFEFTSYCKGRWIKRTLFNVFSTEFRAYPEEEYKEKIKEGVLTVNNKKVTCDYVLQNGDLIKNSVHRHETPVIACEKLKIIHMCDDLIVVDKPCSWPVHPCGRYRYNTVVFVLAKDYNIKNLRTIHRLDRLTSGILMFGRTAAKANQLDKQIRERMVSKEYLCRVVGNFPDEHIMCKEPIVVVSHKLGLCKIGKEGKDCQTEFIKLSFNGKTSLVLCKPKTGRMHQIRVHLQYLGHPISNDPLYNNEVFGKDKGKLANYYKTDEELLQDYINTYNAKTWLGVEDDSCVKNPASEKKNDTNENVDKTSKCFDSSKVTYDSTCFECKVKYKDPVKKDLVMYLHALSYEGPDWKFESQYPYWAKDGFVEDDC